MPSDRGLGRLEAILRSGGVDYWVDSGVLLALVRDGVMNPGEKDIDLGCEEASLPRLLALESAFQHAGYEVTVNRYRGWVYSVAFTPGRRLPADALLGSVHVYYEAGDYLWSPQTQLYVPPPAPDVYAGERSVPGEWLRRFVERRLYGGNRGPSPDKVPQQGGGYRAPEKATAFSRLLRWCYHRLDRGRLAELWPLREVYVPLTWVLPKTLVLPVITRRIGDRDYPVPCQVEAYLAYRYGDWQQPVDCWSYWSDDGAIRHRRPFEVRDELLQGT